MDLEITGSNPTSYVFFTENFFTLVIVNWDKIMGCDMHHQGTGGISGAHAMVGRHKSISAIARTWPVSRSLSRTVSEFPEVTHKTPSLGWGYNQIWQLLTFVNFCPFCPFLSFYVHVCVHACTQESKRVRHKK